MIDSSRLDHSSRTYKSAKNVSYGLIMVVVNAIIGFVNRTFFVKYLGAEYLGLNGLFTEVIAVLSLAELGVGMAINYSLYKPIHEKDFKRVNQLMSLFRKTYNLISVIVFVLGAISLPFIHLVVTDTSYSVSYIRLIYFLFVANTSVSYLFSYNTTFISANQQQYVVTLLEAGARVLFTIVAIVLLIFTRNYVLYLLVTIIQTLCVNVSLSVYVRIKFPYIDFHDTLPQDERKQVFRDIKNIFIKKISGVVTSSTDNILISTLVSTVQVGFYSNYTIFFSLVRTVKNQLSSGTKASIGDLSVASSGYNCMVVLNRLTFLYYLFASIICSALLVCSSDIISLWLGKDYVMSDLIIMVAIFNLYLEIWSEPLWQYLEVSGLFKQDRNIALIGTSINLIVSIILGIKWGIVGIFLGTVSTQLIQLTLKTRLLFKRKLVVPRRSYYRIVGRCLISCVPILLFYFFCKKYLYIGDLWLSIIIKGSASCLVGFLIPLLLFLKSDELTYARQFIRNEISKWKK